MFFVCLKNVRNTKSKGRSLKMELTEFLKISGELPRQRQIYSLILRLGIPAILAYMASVAMQYIDAAMVGSLGAAASASVGVVVSSTWIAGGIIYSATMGFSVQVAHAIGANDSKRAKKVFCEGLLICLVISCMLSAVCIGMSSCLPRILEAEQVLWRDASAYFFIYACSIPAVQIRIFSGAILQSAGNTKAPGILNCLLCLLDIFFNYFLIFPDRNLVIGGLSLHVPGADLGVSGAALGTAISEIIIASSMFFVAFRTPKLRFDFSFLGLSKDILKTASKISIPMTFESVAKDGAHIFLTSVVAPLGTIALAADIFGFTIEQLCYLPGLGISIVATTLVGQALGANRKDLARKFAWSTVKCGVLLVTAVAVVLYIFAPTIFTFFTPDAAVRELGVRVLRIVLLSEPLISASTVIVGALRGAKDTFVPCVITLLCKWGVILPISLLLVKDLGLVGVWIAICAEFCTRGILFLMRLRNEERWLK